MKAKVKQHQSIEIPNSNFIEEPKLSGFAKGMKKYAGMVRIIDMRAVMR